MLFKLIILGAAAYFGFSFFRKNKEKLFGRSKKEEDDSPVELVKDPVCNTFVEMDTPFKVKYYDRVYYFCSQGCRDSFIEQMKNGGKK
ncbi:YHS domain-containing protein [Flexistipes sinusarabici DSM 4947]|uniref:YHS domain-containing protein n=2 Tax=Flexistipes sinusarabici TaxID=2352 RepID=F8E5I2_FLESM|nr:YHS domain-containing protein [Flexistipes sinusarabici]AEI15745.1 YHS domain-containing protein [Flexistipes sinusarabici DSM 4947]HCW93852.1 YHS domain-containing protein [Flexistipes sinusarabici]